MNAMNFKGFSSSLSVLFSFYDYGCSIARYRQTLMVIETAPFVKWNWSFPYFSLPPFLTLTHASFDDKCLLDGRVVPGTA